MRRNSLVIIGLILTFCGSVHPAVAQSPAPDSLRSRQPKTVSLQSDTNDFTMGHREFSRYTTPIQCFVSMMLASEVERGRMPVETVLDTLQDAMADTFGLRHVAAVGRQCGTAFTVANTPVSELGGLLQIALSTQNDTLARAVMERMMQGATPQAQMTLVRAVIGQLLGDQYGSVPGVPGSGGGGNNNTSARTVTPLLQRVSVPDAPLLQSLIQMIDRQGSEDDRLQLQDQLLNHYELRNDIAGIVRQATNLVHVARQQHAFAASYDSVGSFYKRPLVHAYSDLIRIAFYQSPDSMQSLAQQAQHDVGVARFGPRRIVDLRTVSVEETIDQFFPAHATWAGANGTLPVLHADFWYGPDGHPIQIAPPTPGTVTLVVIGKMSAGGETENSPTVASNVRQMLARYGTRGFAVTIMDATRGWIDYGGYLPSPLGPMTPNDEAETLRQYYQTYEHLPVTVGVMVRHFTKRPPPDGRMVQIDTMHLIPKFCNAGVIPGEGDHGCAVLVGRDGIVLWTGTLALNPGQNLFDFRTGFADLLAKAIAQPSRGQGTTAPTPASVIPASQNSNTVGGQ